MRRSEDGVREPWDGGTDQDWLTEMGWFPELRARARRPPVAGDRSALSRPPTPGDLAPSPFDWSEPTDDGSRSTASSATPWPSNPPQADVASDSVPAAPGTEPTTAVPLEQLEAQICALAGGLASSTCRWLRLVEEFDRRKGWAQWGVKSCAHWLAWACSVAPGAAREYVRVATALAGLPLIDKAFAAGELSYSKVRGDQGRR